MANTATTDSSGVDGSTVTPGEFLERAKALAPIIAEYRDRAEQERQLPSEIADALYEYGFQKMLLPKSLGGFETDLMSVYLAVEEVARQDAASGWVAGIMASNGLLSEYLSEEGAQDVFGGGMTFPGGAAMPPGKAVRVPGGYRCSGRWPFASGNANSTCLGVGCAVVEDGEPVMDAEGRPLALMCFLEPGAEVEGLDTWHTTGLRGTGSNDIQIDDVFVPEHRTFPLMLVMTGQPDRPGVVYRRSFLTYARPKMAAISIGIARAALEAFKEIATAKTPAGASSKLGLQHTTHEKYGQAVAQVGAARAYLLEAITRLDADLEEDWENPDEVVALTRLASAHAAESAAAAVTSLYTIAGGTSIYARSPLERLFRDIHTATHHIAVSYSNIEMVGQYELGFGLEDRR